MTDTVKLLSDDEVAELQARPSTELGGYRRVLLRQRERDALCATVRALRRETERTYTPSIVEALRLLDDAGYGKEVPNSLSDMIKKVLTERDNLLNRSHQTVNFECGCVFRQDGLDAEPQLIEHCTLWAEMERNAMIDTIAESEKQNTALREQLAQYDRERQELWFFLTRRPASELSHEELIAIHKDMANERDELKGLVDRIASGETEWLNRRAGAFKESAMQAIQAAANTEEGGGDG